MTYHVDFFDDDKIWCNGQYVAKLIQMGTSKCKILTFGDDPKQTRQMSKDEKFVESIIRAVKDQYPNYRIYVGYFLHKFFDSEKTINDWCTLGLKILSPNFSIENLYV